LTNAPFFAKGRQR